MFLQLRVIIFKYREKLVLFNNLYAIISEHLIYKNNNMRITLQN